MKKKLHKVFKAGVHKNDGRQVWGNEDVKRIATMTAKHSPDMIPICVEHRRLPVLGFAKKSSLRETAEDGIKTLWLEVSEFAEDFEKTLKETGLVFKSIGLGSNDEILELSLTQSPAVSGLGAAFSKATGKTIVQFNDDDLAGELDAEEESKEPDGEKTPSKFSQALERIAEIFEKVSNNKTGTEMTEQEKNALAAAQAQIETLKREKAASDLIANNAVAAVEANAVTVFETQMRQFCEANRERVPQSLEEQLMPVFRDLRKATVKHKFSRNGADVEMTSLDVLKEILANKKTEFVKEEVATEEKTGFSASEKSAEKGPGKKGGIAEELRRQVAQAKRA
jgi:hypothetical protein